MADDIKFLLWFEKRSFSAQECHKSLLKHIRALSPQRIVLNKAVQCLRAGHRQASARTKTQNNKTKPPKRNLRKL